MHLCILPEILVIQTDTLLRALVATSGAMMEGREAMDTIKEIGFLLCILKAIGRVVERMSEIIFQ